MTQMTLLYVNNQPYYNSIGSQPITVATTSRMTISHALCSNTGTWLSSPTKQYKTFTLAHNHSLASAALLILCGDIQLNPGPRPATVYPCGCCELAVDWSDPAVGCEQCDLWYHKTCVEISSAEYGRMQNSDSSSWYCYKCKTPNDSRFLYHSYEVPVHNPYEPLSLIHDDSVFTVSPELRFLPTRHSSPLNRPTTSIRPELTFDLTRSDTPSSRTSRSDLPQSSSDGTSSNFDPYQVPGKNNNLRIIVANCNGAPSKKANMEHLIKYVDPDILILTETKIDDNISLAEFLPPHFNGEVRQDRNKWGGGVMVAIRNTFIIEKIELPEINCETAWAKISLKNHHPLYIGAFYRPPSDK